MHQTVFLGTEPLLEYATTSKLEKGLWELEKQFFQD